VQLLVKNNFANKIDFRYSETMSPLNLDRLQSWIDQGRIDPTKPITLKELVDSRCLHGIKDGVKILARVYIQLGFIATCET
jgi:hypothetical protein